MNITGLAKRLPQYDEQEARSIVRLLLFDVFGLTLTDICGGALDSLSIEEESRLEQLMRQLEEGAPVQYVTGKALFADRTFNVRPGVLIPRPETEELCRMVERNCPSQATILDIGTGSGCIAITLALNIPQASVTAWDISREALSIAEENAHRHGATVNFQLQDALSPPEAEKKWDVIVSNPPYICINEQKDMEPHVLNHEPHQALFVPDDNPLLFYEAITRYAAHALSPQGFLAFEINPLYATETITMMNSYGFDIRETIEQADGHLRTIGAMHS